MIINILTFPSKFNSHLSKGEDVLHRRPEIADRASGACSRCGAEETRKEAEYKLLLDILRKPRRHDEDHVRRQCDDVDRIAAECLAAFLALDYDKKLRQWTVKKERPDKINSHPL